MEDNKSDDKRNRSRQASYDSLLKSEVPFGEYSVQHSKSDIRAISPPPHQTKKGHHGGHKGDKTKRPHTHSQKHLSVNEAHIIVRKIIMHLTDLIGREGENLFALLPLELYFI